MIEKNQKLKRMLVWLPARLYELGVRLRVAAYETGYLKPKRLAATTISIGNIAVGGTGKTPMVHYVARYIEEEGHSVAILTRGYGRKSTGGRTLNGPEGRGGDGAKSYLEYGDEPVMLARKLPDVPVIINKDRYESGTYATRELGRDVLILDDAYQHLSVARDLNILLLDATDPFAGFEMLPFGRLREPLYGIKRADVVIITRADRPFDQGQVAAIIKYYCGDEAPVMYVYSSIKRLRHLGEGAAYEANQFTGWNVSLMCGIGNPHAFADDILQIGINIVAEHFYNDHHAFTQQDLDEVTRAAREAGADAIITTEKDAVRLEGLALPEVPVYVAEIEIESDDEVRLKSLLLRTLVKKG